mmetsp:Transcript_15382/g.31089  ORF Transcript_15382/g.31089 Transcript_15382/m.31089 type:complete len:209 (-) Transcript_15382:362-988(-)
MVILSSLGASHPPPLFFLLDFFFFFFFFLSSSSESESLLSETSKAPALSACFLRSSSACFAPSSSAAFLAAAASLRAFTSASLAISRLYSSVSPASWRLRYAAALAAFSFSSRSLRVMGCCSADDEPRSPIFMFFTGARLAFSVSIIPSSPLALRSFLTYWPSAPSEASSPSFRVAPDMPAIMAARCASASSSPESFPFSSASASPRR